MGYVDYFIEGFWEKHTMRYRTYSYNSFCLSEDNYIIFCSLIILEKWSQRMIINNKEEWIWVQTVENYSHFTKNTSFSTKFVISEVCMDWVLGRAF